MDSSDSIYTVYNKNEETIEYYNNDNRIYERTRDIENSINNLLIDENKQKPQNLICVYFCFFFIIGTLVTVITYLIIKWS
jgi:hypothetical protein